MKYVIDCSAAFPVYVAEPLTGKATALRDAYLNAIHELLAPDFLATEMSNALIVAERRGLTPRETPAVSSATSSSRPRSCTPFGRTSCPGPTSSPRRRSPASTTACTWPWPSGRAASWSPPTPSW